MSVKINNNKLKTKRLQLLGFFLEVFGLLHPKLDKSGAIDHQGTMNSVDTLKEGAKDLRSLKTHFRMQA